MDRQFEPEAPNRVRTADITYVSTREGRPYLADMEDLHSRQIVGWSMGERIDSRPVADGLVAHSDRGITCSESRRANCRDDAAMESFFASLKKELVHDEDYATREEARASIFESIEAFDNRAQRHSSPSYRSPIVYERAG